MDKDSALKIEINGLKNTLTSTNYKTKFVIVLLGEDGVDDISDTANRTANIRRATGLDSRLIWYHPLFSKESEKRDFVQNLLTSLETTSIDYYRDLSKHARRKKSRNITPIPTIQPTSGTSQTLSLQGWNLRYEFKLGVLAEFRQEMDPASRNYEAAYQSLFSEEVFESLAGWSPRFNEARMLSDVLALRIIRCQLWDARTTAATRTWTDHRSRVQDLVDRKGRGTENYGWEAWESIWTKVMAQLIERADLDAFSLEQPIEVRNLRAGSIYALSENQLDSLPPLPWELLHHAGYWLNRSWKHVLRRRQLALRISEEDRQPPGSSPASAIASKAHLYDTYLTLPPHQEAPLSGPPLYDYQREIQATLDSSLNFFASKGQTRRVMQLELDKAAEHLREGELHFAMEVITRVWSRRLWRVAAWWRLMARAGDLLWQCAVIRNDAETMVRLTWELQHAYISRHGRSAVSLVQDLSSIHGTTGRSSVVIRAEDSISPLGVDFTVRTAEGNVGEPLQAQLVLTSFSANPIPVSEVKIVFEGGVRPIRLLALDTKDPKSGPRVIIYNIDLKPSTRPSDVTGSRDSMANRISLLAHTHLLIEPGYTHVYDLILTPREAGEVKILSISAISDTRDYLIDFVTSELCDDVLVWWTLEHRLPTQRRIGRHREKSLVTILPKPPKLQIELPDLSRQYYTNEYVAINIVLTNQEEEDIEGEIEMRLVSPLHSLVRLSMLSADDNKSSEAIEVADGSLALEVQRYKLPRSESKIFEVAISETHEPIHHQLQIQTRYHLISDEDSILTSSQIVQLAIIRPFEANYDFEARSNDDKPWPDFFQADPMLLDTERDKFRPSGISHLYALTANMVSFVTEEIEVDSAQIVLQQVMGDATCIAGEARNFSAPQADHSADHELQVTVVQPQESSIINFPIEIQKLAIGDRHPVALDLGLSIAWRRKLSVSRNNLTRTMLEIPRFILPMAEPRVLAYTKPFEAAIQLATTLIYTVENPSMHFLTFNLTMESCEEFAFSGAKHTNVSLTPVSRTSVEYQIYGLGQPEIAQDTDRWVRVNLNVVDAYFGNSLKTQAAGTGVRDDSKRGGVLVKLS